MVPTEKLAKLNDDWASRSSSIIDLKSFKILEKTCFSLAHPKFLVNESLY